MNPPDPPDTNASRFRAFFTGAGLPVFILAASAVYEIFLLAVIFAPVNSGPWSVFSEDFKIWCFRYDPRTGGMSWGSVWAMLLQPLFVCGLTAIFGWRSLTRLQTRGSFRRILNPALAGLAVGLAAVGSLFATGWSAAERSREPLPFPGERIRTALVPPEFRLTDQMGESFGLADAEGKVVLMTGVYAMCATACPEILREIRQLLDELPAGLRERLTVVALSLNPEYETSDVMMASAAGYGFTHPEFRYLNGDPDLMHDLLTRLQFSPNLNPVTRQIEHANLFHLIDRNGRIAYRLSLDQRHRQWLRDGIVALTTEAAAGSAGGIVRIP